MRLSETFAKTTKTIAENESVHYKLLVRAGFIDQLAAGIYSYLPLGLRVLRKIENVVREEMNGIGGEEILMPILHPAANWKTTGGWNQIDILFKLKSRTGQEYALGQSEEEVVTPLVMQRLKSYKDLPKSVYQIHWKYRDELRAKSGILRGREFYMKDMYSFHTDQGDFDNYYETVKQAYLRIYDRLGLQAKVTEASGGLFSEKISYEFEVLTDAGEDDILYCEDCDYCINTEIAKTKAGDKCPSCGKGKLKKAKASEVGNVFDLGQKYTKAFDLSVSDPSDKPIYPIMGCFGLGISRVMGVIAEKFNDEHGLIWPKSVAPADVHIVTISEDTAVKEAGDKLHQLLEDSGKVVILDDRDVSAGAKFADADLIGVPLRVTISPKTLEKNSVELKVRSEKDSKLVELSKLQSTLE